MTRSETAQEPTAAPSFVGHAAYMELAGRLLAQVRQAQELFDLQEQVVAARQRLAQAVNETQQAEKAYRDTLPSAATWQPGADRYHGYFERAAVGLWHNLNSSPNPLTADRLQAVERAVHRILTLPGEPGEQETTTNED